MLSASVLVLIIFDLNFSSQSFFSSRGLMEEGKGREDLKICYSVFPSSTFIFHLTVTSPHRASSLPKDSRKRERGEKILKSVTLCLPSSIFLFLNSPSHDSFFIYPPS